jgi:hypothetical protein
MNWRGGAANPPHTSADTSRTAVPYIPGYITWRGREMLHARHQGTFAEARSEGPPWHVVAFTPQELVEAVKHGQRPGP